MLSEARGIGAAKRKNEAGSLAEQIHAEAESLLTKGKPKRNLAGLLSVKFGLSDRRIRQILNEKRKRQEKGQIE